MPYPLRWCLASAVLAGILTLGALVPAAAAHPGPGRPPPAARIPIPGTHPAWATARHQVSRGPAVSGTVTTRVYLAGRDPRGLAAFAAAVSAPGGRDYRHFLTPAQVAARFGPRPGQVAAVRSWLTAAGMTVTGAGGGAAGAYLGARGTVGSIGRAFGVALGWYHAPGGHIYRAPDRAASAPRQAAAAVLAVTGLTTAPELVSPGAVPAGAGPAAAGPAGAGPVGARAARRAPPAREATGPCSHYYAERSASRRPEAYGRHWPWAICGYVPRQLRSAYQVTASGRSGAGQTVAIVDAYRSPTLLADADRYARHTGDVPFRPGQYRQYQTGRFSHARGCHRRGWYLEQALDVEAVHGLAPAARVRYVGGASCHNDDLAQALSFIVNRHLASIVTDSWGSLEHSHTLNAVYTTIFQAGAAEGIGFYFSSGDNGYNAPGENPQSKRLQVEFPAASPWVTAVGGTSLAIGSSGQYQWETAWGNVADPVAPGGRRWLYPPPGRYRRGFAGAGGGGVSTRYRQPSYQRGVVPDSLASRLPDGRRASTPMRVVPDVSAVANQFTGMLTGRTAGRHYRLLPVGGTSLACPVFAAIQADAQQAAGHALGFANPVLYRRYRTSAFHDVTGEPPGPVHLSVVHRYYEHAASHSGPRIPSLFAIAINGRGKAALRAARGYDDATGLGSPWHYLQSFGS